MALYTEALITPVIKHMVGQKIFKATFLKKNGDVREMNCKIGVKKHLKGGINVNNRDRLIKRFVGNTGNIYNLVEL